MTKLDTRFPGATMSDLDASNHIAVLFEENQRRNHAQYRSDDASPVGRVGVVGAGVMGAVVAASAIGCGVPIVITDQNHNALASVTREVAKRLSAETTDSLAQTDQRVTALLTVTPDLAEVAACDLVVESIVESLTVKHSFYAVLEKLCSDETLIASNTSTLPIAELAAHLRRPERFCGLHYFPSHDLRKIMEVIPSNRTTKATTARLVRFTERIRRIPIVVSDGRGFVVNRILMAYMNAGIRLVMQGVDIRAIDSAAEAFGMRMGPIRLYDEVGVDVAVQCGLSFAADSDTLIARTPLPIRMMKAKQLGLKSGRGFYIHESTEGDGQAGELNPIALEIVDRVVDSRVDLSPVEIQAAITLPMVIEATRLLELNRAKNAGQVDLAAMCGFRFAELRGGPLYWTDQIGAEVIVETLKLLQPLGPHLRPTQTLLEVAKNHRRFYDHIGESGVVSNPTPDARRAT